MKIKRINKIALLLFSLLYCSFRLFAQNKLLPPYPAKNLIDPTVIANISKDTEGYSFSYKITNGAKALQNIYIFMVEIKSHIISGLSPLNWRHSSLNYDTIDVAEWSSRKRDFDIRPNGNLVGFNIKSKGLPGIERYWMRARETVKGHEGQYDPATTSIFITSLCRTSIGPTDPPYPFVPLNFIDIILSYKHQALNFNWIADRKDEKDDDDDKEDEGQGIVRKLDRRLDNARIAFIKKDTSKAREELLKFVKKVEKLYAESNEDKKKGREKEQSTFTNEAYALLKYNAEYLIQRLPEKKLKGEKEKN